MARHTTKSKKKQSPSRILDMVYAFRPARVLLTSFELGIFTAIGDSPKESREIAQTLGTSERATDRLMNVLCGMGFLKKKGSRFLNTPLTARYLVKDTPDYLAGLMHQVDLWKTWSTLTQAVREGSSVTVRGEIGDRGSGWLEAFIEAMHMRAQGQAGIVARLINLRGVRRVLDVGGGSGAFSMAFVRTKKGVQAVVFDLPQVTVLTRKFLEGEGLTNSIKTTDGNYETDSLGSGFDVVFLSAIIHSNSAEVNRLLFKKANDALTPEGRLVVLDHVMREDRTAPLAGAFFSLNMLVGTKAGDTYTESEIRQWMTEAGFKYIRRKSTPFGTDLMIGKKKT
jgi:2-polyprenyl-3-methyl-5-hydroxy-6-metoxy-1,4-benzoquinol methylase